MRTKPSNGNPVASKTEPTGPPTVPQPPKQPSKQPSNGTVPPITVLQIPRMEDREIVLKCVGLNELVINSMMNKMGEAPVKAGGKSSIEEQFNRARYIVQGHDCLKAITLKKAIASAWPFCDKGNKLKGMINKVLYVHGDVTSEDGVPFIKIEGKPEMFTTEVRTKEGKSILITRPRYFPWAFTMRITYNPRHISDQLVLQLVANAGVYCGVGENRPSKTGGTWGRFQIDEGSKIVCRDIIQ